MHNCPSVGSILVSGSIATFVLSIPVAVRSVCVNYNIFRTHRHHASNYALIKLWLVFILSFIFLTHSFVDYNVPTAKEMNNKSFMFDIWVTHVSPQSSILIFSSFLSISRAEWPKNRIANRAFKWNYICICRFMVSHQWSRLAVTSTKWCQVISLSECATLLMEFRHSAHTKRRCEMAEARRKWKKKKKTKTAIHWNMRALSHAHGFSSTSFSGKFTKYHFWLTNRAAERIKQPRKTHTHTHSDRQTKAICVHFEVIFFVVLFIFTAKNIFRVAQHLNLVKCVRVSPIQRMKTVKLLIIK